MEDIQKRIMQLREELHQHNYNYYVLSAPVIPDVEFDQMLRELQDLENEHPEYFDKNSPTQRVGSDISTSFKQVQHRYPMLSLANTYSEAEIQDFYERIRKALNEDFEIVCELKYDGTSISLLYENGMLSQAITRGDGVQGDDVTENVRTIRSVPLKLRGSDYPDSFEVRGEIMMPWEVFESLNREREKQGEALFANPRNATSGTVKQQNSSIVASRKLDAIFYYLLGEELPTDNHYDNLQKMKSWGIKISSATKKCNTLEEIFSFIRYWDVERKNLPFATDGIVLKVNSLLQQKNLGYTAKSPRWAISFKYQAERALTTLQSVSYQIGRIGTVTPVANLEPVLLSGTIVKRASLHNSDIMENLDLHIGDKLFVEKGGEIIPKIVGVDVNLRTADLGEKVSFVKNCPECGARLIRYEGEAAHYCPNDTGCPPQIKGRIEHFVSRRAMNIEGLGSETIDLLYRIGMINDPSDLYQLKWQELSRLERLGEKSAKNIIAEVEKSVEIPFERVLFALGIRFVGETVAKKIARNMKNMDVIKNASLEELVGIDEVGNRIAESVKAYFEKEPNLQMLERLKEAGVQFSLDETTLAAHSDKLQGKTIVISGTFTLHSRDEYKALIEQHGGKNSGSVSKKTDILLAGDNMGPAKLQKAENWGIKIMNENEFLQMLQE
ncbi:MAG: NAD-dependent DNA ligase LigA [Candidatus Azobacteroides sp.]|nr:NAD-dependent DNA ligase LigA [Candidatus Azobacteroides sp.]